MMRAAIALALIAVSAPAWAEDWRMICPFPGAPTSITIDGDDVLTTKFKGKSIRIEGSSSLGTGMRGRVYGGNEDPVQMLVGADPDAQGNTDMLSIDGKSYRARCRKE